MSLRLAIPALIAALTLTSHADGPGAIGNFGPTGIEIAVRNDGLAHVTAVQPGSPADGLLERADVILQIQGKEMPEKLWDQLKLLSDIITAAEASDGTIRLNVRNPEGETRDLEIRIPTMPAFSETRPLECPKTAKIIANKAAWLRAQAADEEGLRNLARHNLYNGMAILAMLSTGQDEDLDVVRNIYAERMKNFTDTDTGPHTWHNGWQGMAVCEYYLRTGDKSVMPLINAIAKSAKKFQVNGGWVHWEPRVNPQYVGGGLLNAAGTNMLTTLLLAKLCGAEVDDDALLSALRYFYRFVGHGANAYGDHRPEAGYGGINGKDQQLAFAMQIASLATNGEVYAMARDRAAVSTLYSYPFMLNGHTGPIGAAWHAPTAAFFIEKKPELYRHRWDATDWFHELSRRHDGSFVKAACARYNITDFGTFMLVGLTAPMRTLQLTGAPPSPHAVPFELPEHPWGREADLAFFTLDGGPEYQKLPRLNPVEEMQAIHSATREQLAAYAQHPEHVYREHVARTIRDHKHFTLIEELLESPDPLARHTACMAINFFQPWRVTASPGWISLQAISPDDFTPRMFDALIAIVKNEDEALWLVDQAMIALALASTEQTMPHLDTLLPWLRQNDEWWLQESAAIALSPALYIQEGLDRVLPEIITTLAPSTHTKSRSYVEWMLSRTAERVAPEMKTQIAEALKTIFVETPTQPEHVVPDGMDLTGISSIHLSSTLHWLLEVDPTMAPQVAQLSIPRLHDGMRLREINIQATRLIDAAKKIDEADRKAVATVLNDHYKPFIIEENREALAAGVRGDPRRYAAPLNMILDIRALAGSDGAWELIAPRPGTERTWHFTSFQPVEDPRDRPEQTRHGRYREVEFPETLANWQSEDFDPAANAWKSVTAEVGKTPPATFRDVSGEYRKFFDEADEFLLMRTEFDLADTDYELFRLHVHTRQGYQLYLNGKLLREDRWHTRNWQPRIVYLSEDERQQFRKGRNVLAMKTLMQYYRGREGAADIYLEALREFPKID